MGKTVQNENPGWPTERAPHREQGDVPATC